MKFNLFKPFGQAWTGFPLIAMKPHFLKEVTGKVSKPVQYDAAWWWNVLCLVGSGD